MSQPPSTGSRATRTIVCSDGRKGVERMGSDRMELVWFNGSDTGILKTASAGGAVTPYS
jgi:hypothetical protein